MQKARKNSFITTVHRWIISISLLFLFLMLIAVIIENHSNFIVISQKILTSYVNLHKTMIEQDVSHVVDAINKHKDRIEKKPGYNLEYEKDKVLDDIKEIYVNDKKRYIFILDYDGSTLLHPTKKSKIRYNLSNITDPNGIKIIKSLKSVVKNPKGGFVSYTWKHPVTGKYGKKITFAKRVDDWGWIVGTGFHFDDALSEINKFHSQLHHNLQRRLVYHIIISVVLFLCLIFLFNKFSKKWKNDLRVFASFFRDAELYNKKIDIDKMHFSEFEMLAERANNMIDHNSKMRDELTEEQKEKIVTINSITDGLITTDADGKIELMNHAAEDLTGYSLDDVSGKLLSRVFKIIDNLSRRVLENPLEEALKKNINIKSIRSPLLVGANGGEYYIDYNATPVSDSSHNIIGGIIVFRDITEKIELDNELVKVKRLESIGLLAGGIAHDFNNILTGIYGNVEIATSKLSEGHPAYTFLRRASSSMDRAKKLTNQLLTFAKGGAPIMEHINLKNIVESTVKFHMSGCNIKTHIKIPEGLWQVKADGSQISQVIENLVINAKQSMADSGNLYITLENIEKGSKSKLDVDCVKFEIRDEGTGITREKLPKIFDPYYTTKDVGYGLGLSTVYSIITKHSGEIEVESIFGEGTVFTLYLPSTRESIKESEGGELDVVSSSLTPLHILVMDNEASVLELTTDILEGWGHLVCTVKDGEEAILKYRNAMDQKIPFDLVIMDVTIPGAMGGKDAVRGILQIDKDAKVIVCSGYSTDPVMSNFMEFGFVGKIEKPFTADQFKKVVNSILMV